ncbi:hypothetical protein K8I61_07410 [bacterium]|nr:hypothetical protein [bacterium]
MSKRVAVIVVAMLLAPALASALDVNGHLMTYGNQRVLHVWGTPYERGYAQGYHLAGDIMDNLEIYAFPPEGAGPLIYEMARAWVRNHFGIADAFLDEAIGMKDGMLAAGMPAYVPIIKRDFDEYDIVTLVGISEIAGLLCSTLAGWGDATSSDPDYPGALIVGHNTDYVMEPEGAFTAGINALIIAHTPDDPDQQRYAGIAYPGFIGLVAGMNESGIGAMVNRGAIVMDPDTVQWDPEILFGVWETRMAIAARDENGDGKNTVQDAIDHLEAEPLFSASIWQFFGPSDRSDPPMVSYHANHFQRAIRVPADDVNFAPDAMVEFNWETALVPQRSPVEQLRYISALSLYNLYYSRKVTQDNLWDFLLIESGEEPNSVTLHSMIFVPDAMRVGVSYWHDYENEPLANHQWYDFDDLFEMPDPPPDDDDDAADDDASDDDDDAADDDDADFEDDDDAADDDDDATLDDDDASDDDAIPASDDDDNSDSGCGC